MAKKASSKKKTKVIPKVEKHEYVTLTQVVDFLEAKYDKDYADTLYEWIHSEYAHGIGSLIELFYKTCEEDLAALAISRSVLSYKFVLRVLREEFPGLGLNIHIDK